MMTGEPVSTSLSNQVEDLGLARQCIMVDIDRLALSPVRLSLGVVLKVDYGLQYVACAHSTLTRNLQTTSDGMPMHIGFANFYASGSSL